jgi:hypothetical protein
MKREFVFLPISYTKHIEIINATVRTEKYNTLPTDAIDILPGDKTISVYKE